VAFTNLGPLQPGALSLRAMIDSRSTGEQPLSDLRHRSPEISRARKVKDAADRASAEKAKAMKAFFRRLPRK